MTDRTWGCAKCWEGEAESAVEKLNSLPGHALLLDESHLIIGTRRCADCGQRFVTIFTETIDWADGEDPQHRSYVPVSESELAQVTQADESAKYNLLLEMGRGRGTLEWDNPKSGIKKMHWSAGLFYRPHD